MKKYLLAAASLVALAAPAAAADMAARPMYTKAPPMIAAVYNWTGFYVGINGGGAFGSKCWNFVAFGGAPIAAPNGAGCQSLSGGTVGGQVGYNWQAGAWVFGVEAQGNWANLSGTNASTFAAGFTNRSRVDAYGLFTGRVGYAFNNVLLYVKGGAAVAADRYDYWATPTPAVIVANGSETRWGAAVGAGLEFGFAPNWTAGVEYNHLFLGSRDVTLSTTETIRVRQDLDTVTAKVNYKF